MKSVCVCAADSGLKALNNIIESGLETTVNKICVYAYNNNRKLYDVVKVYADNMNDISTVLVCKIREYFKANSAEEAALFFEVLTCGDYHITDITIKEHGVYCVCGESVIYKDVKHKESVCKYYDQRFGEGFKESVYERLKMCDL